MSELSKSSNSIQDDRLADFTDQALAGRVDRVESNIDDETFALEQTILRLKNALPPAALDQSTIKQMQARFKARVKREAREVKQPFWKKWFEPQSRPQFAMAFAVMAALIVFVIFSPPATVGTSASATALSPVNGVFAIIALAGVLLIFVWAKRRK